MQFKCFTNMNGEYQQNKNKIYIHSIRSKRKNERLWNKKEKNKQSIKSATLKWTMNDKSETQYAKKLRRKEQRIVPNWEYSVNIYIYVIHVIAMWDECA